DALGLAEEFGEGFYLAIEGGGFFAAEGAGLGFAGVEGAEGGLDFAALAFAGDGAEHAPNVFFGLEEFLALAFADDAADEAPTDEFAEVLVGVAAAGSALWPD